MTIPEIFQKNAAQWPEREALIATRWGRDSTVTFSELQAASDDFAMRLAAHQLGRESSILVFVPMSIELYIAMLGIFRVGATAVFLDPSSGLSHINACCKKLPPAAVVSVLALRALRPWVRGLRKIPHVFSPPRKSAHGTTPLPLELPAPDDPALITFTSGSTGEPKAAVRSHRFLIAQHAALKTSIALESGERDLTTLPVFVLANLASGVTSILPDAKISRPGSVNARRLARQTRRLQPNRSGGSPAFYERLLEAPCSLDGLKKITTGGAPVFPSLLQNLKRALPRAKIVAVYGSTEAEPIAHVDYDEIAELDWKAMREGKGLLAGRPIPEIQLRIVPDQWGSRVSCFGPLGEGLIGEILVTGEHVLKGYLHGRGNEETKVRINNDIWHRTGDAGCLDSTGRLWLFGRCSAKVVGPGGTLYPFAVECVAMSYPFVRRAAFVVLQTKRVLVIESKGTEKDHSEILKSLGWAGVEEVMKLKVLPVDARHNAKINYPQLMKRLG
ncbi:MAG: AMP-binding protein [Terrimicrobiaceae bacterium]